MKFTFNITANDGEELETKISASLQQFFPSKVWNYTLESVQQSGGAEEETEPSKGKKKTQTKLVWEITVEVYPVSLMNAVVSVCGYGEKNEHTK